MSQVFIASISPGSHHIIQASPLVYFFDREAMRWKLRYHFKCDEKGCPKLARGFSKAKPSCHLSGATCTNCNWKLIACSCIPFVPINLSHKLVEMRKIFWVKRNQSCREHSFSEIRFWTLIIEKHNSNKKRQRKSIHNYSRNIR